MANHVTMIEAFGFPPQYLTFNGSGVALHSFQNHPANFHLAQDLNTLDRYLEVYNSPNTRVHYSTPVNCSLTNSVIASNTQSSIVRTTPGSTDVMIYFENSPSERFYVRVNAFGGNTVELVCQQYVTDAIANGGFNLKELQFNLIQVNMDDIYSGILPQPPTVIPGLNKPVITIPVKPGNGDFDLEQPGCVRGSGGCYNVGNDNTSSNEDGGSGRGFVRGGGFRRLNSNEVGVEVGPVRHRPGNHAL